MVKSSLERRPRVFVLEEIILYDKVKEPRPKYDLTGAVSYGDIVILHKTKQSPILTAPGVELIREKLIDFTDRDYLLPIGNPLYVTVMGAIAADVNFGRYKVLLWDKRYEKYIETQVEV